MKLIDEELSLVGTAAEDAVISRLEEIAVDVTTLETELDNVVASEKKVQDGPQVKRMIDEHDKITACLVEDMKNKKQEAAQLRARISSLDDRKQTAKNTVKCVKTLHMDKEQQAREKHNFKSVRAIHKDARRTLDRLSAQRKYAHQCFLNAATLLAELNKDFSRRDYELIRLTLCSDYECCKSALQEKLDIVRSLQDSRTRWATAKAQKLDLQVVHAELRDRISHLVAQQWR